jgi:tetratricopeptide (TPR) repeat protein
MRALQGYEEALGPNYTSTLDTVNNLGLLYADQGKLGEAEKMYMRAVQGYKEALESETLSRYRPALNNWWSLAALFAIQNETAKARTMYIKALSGFQEILGPSSNECQQLERSLLSLDEPEGKMIDPISLLSLKMLTYYKHDSEAATRSLVYQTPDNDKSKRKSRFTLSRLTRKLIT